MGALYRMSLELLFMAKEETLIDDVNKKKCHTCIYPFGIGKRFFELKETSK